MSTLNAINDKMYKSLAQVGGRIDALFYCPHTAEVKCECRKPKPGMLKGISRRFNVPLNKIPVVGDSLRDLEAADSVGAQPILVKTGKGDRTIRAGGLPKMTLQFKNLGEAVKHIISNQS